MTGEIKELSKEDCETIDKILAQTGTTQDNSILILKQIQSKFGYIPKEAMAYVADKTGLQATLLYGVATFYSQFKLTPSGKNVIKICHGTACHVKGATHISDIISEALGIREGETTEDRLFTLEVVACLGCCSLAPVMMINDKVYGRLTTESIKDILKQYQNAGDQTP